MAILYVVVSIADEGSMYGPGHRLFRRSWQYFHNLLALARLVRQAGEFPRGLREQAVERLLQCALRCVERRRLALDPGVVMLQPRLVQAVERRDQLDPSLAPCVSSTWPAAHSIKSRRTWDQQNARITSPPRRRTSLLYAL